jgi:transcriptional regulator with XRE-family HTH domain
VTVSKEARDQLGAELKTLRKQADLTLRDVEALVGVSNAAVSYWENGHRLPGNDDLRRLLEALQATAEDRERILGMRRAMDDAPGQISYGAPQIGEHLAQLIDFERTASRIVDIAPLVIPGLLQVAEYSRAIMGHLPDAEIRTALRAGRRDILIRKVAPVELIAFIDTEVLVRPIAPRDVMVDQLRHLLEMGGRSNITIQLVPSTHPGYTPMLGGQFKVIEFPQGRPMVLHEHYRSSMFLRQERDVKDLLDAVKEIEEAAMTPAKSAGVIEDIVNGMETRTT